MKKLLIVIYQFSLSLAVPKYGPQVSTPAAPKSTPTPTSTTVARSSHCNAGYLSGNMANHIQIGPVGPIKCANSWSNDKWNSVLMTKAFTDLKLASIYCERVYKGSCDTIIEYKRGKSTDDCIYSPCSITGT